MSDITERRMMNFIKKALVCAQTKREAYSTLGDCPIKWRELGEAYAVEALCELIMWHFFKKEYQFRNGKYLND